MRENSNMRKSLSPKLPFQRDSGDGYAMNKRYIEMVKLPAKGLCFRTLESAYTNISLSSRIREPMLTSPLE